MLLLLLVFLRHVAPVTVGHVVELFTGIDALADADGLEVGTPELLEKLVVSTEHIAAELAVGKVERYGGFVFEGDADDGVLVFLR